MLALRIRCLCVVLSAVSGLWGSEIEDLLFLDNPAGVEMHLRTFHYTGHDEFSLGNFSDNWDTSRRYEWSFGVDDYWESRREFFGALYVFWEHREWARSDQFIETKAFGAGYEFGGRFWLVNPRGRPPINIALAPYGRMGFAYQDVDYANILEGGNLIDGAVDVERLEFFAGVDLLVQFSHRGQASLGLGAHLWFADQVAADVNGNQVSTESFNGDSVFLRLSLGLEF